MPEAQASAPFINRTARSLTRCERHCVYFVLIPVCVIGFLLCIGLLIGFIPELHQVHETNCTLLQKGCINNTDCGPFQVFYVVQTDYYWDPQPICSPVDQCGVQAKKGPQECYDLYPDNLIQYTYAELNSTMNCYVDTLNTHVYWDDPRVYSWRKINSGIAMGAISLVIAFVIFGIYRRSFDCECYRDCDSTEICYNPC